MDGSHAATDVEHCRTRDAERAHGVEQATGGPARAATPELRELATSGAIVELVLDPDTVWTRHDLTVARDCGAAQIAVR